MALRHRIKSWVEKVTSTQIYLHRALPRGIDIVHDLRNHLPSFQVDTIFDVGANVGQSTDLFLNAFSGSIIYSFEPVAESFYKLQSNIQAKDRVRFHQLAFGASRATGKMILEGTPDMFFLEGNSTESSMETTSQTEMVDIVTIDDFCIDNHIDRISYLKIDTEGADLNVLRGGVDMLNERKIDLIQIEAGMNPANKRHASFDEIKAFMESFQYSLFGIYEQVEEWPIGACHLRRTNPVFISPRLSGSKNVEDLGQ